MNVRWVLFLQYLKGLDFISYNFLIQKGQALCVYATLQSKPNNVPSDVTLMSLYLSNRFDICCIGMVIALLLDKFKEVKIRRG